MTRSQALALGSPVIACLLLSLYRHRVAVGERCIDVMIRAMAVPADKAATW